MQIIEAIQQRKSVRGYRPDPVPREVLRNILEIAGRSPSAMNSQPWEFAVIGGEVLDRVRQANLEKLRNGVPPDAEHAVTGWSKESIYRTRQVELAIGLFQLMGIERHDVAKRTEWLERGFRFFGAPAAIVVMTDRSLLENTYLIDVGIVIQSICLTALEFGLATCIEDQGCMYPGVLHDLADIPASKRIVMAVAIGYPDWDFPANRIQTTRVPVDTITSWRGL